MANRYWVGGTGTWSTTNTANWSDTSGGAGGFSVPTLSDDVFFDANSGTAPYTVTANNSSLACQNLDCTGFVGTLNTGSTLNVYGNLVISSAMGLTGSSGIYNLRFKATTPGKTIQPGGNSAQGRLIFDGVGGEWSLQGAVSVGGSNGGIQVLAGTFITNGYSIYTGREGISSTGTAVRSMQLGASTITISLGNYNVTGSNVTVTHTGTLTCGNVSQGVFAGGGGSYGSVTVQSGAFAENTAVYGSNTFQNLTVGGAPISLLVEGNQTITGTFTCNGAGYTSPTSTSNWRMVKITGVVFGDGVTDINPNAPQATITANNFSLNYAAFANIVLAGPGTPLAGEFSDCGNNAGISFPASKTVYARNTTSGTWISNIRWSSTSGGAADTKIPYAQDNIILDANTGTGSIGFPGGDHPGYDVGNLNASNYSGTIDFSQTTRVLGNISMGASTILSGQLNLYGHTNTTLTAYNTLGIVQIRKKTNASLTLQNSVTSNNILYVYTGDFTLGGYDYTCSRLFSSYTTLRKINFGSNNIIIPSNNTTVISLDNPNNLSYSGTGAVNCTYSGSTGTRTISYGNSVAPANNQSLPIKVSAGSDIVSLTSNSNYQTFVDFTGFTGTLSLGTLYVNKDIVIPAGVTCTTGTLVLYGNNAGSYIVNLPSTVVLPQLNIQCDPTVTFTLAANTTITNTVFLVSGNFSVGNYALTCTTFSSSYTNTRTLAFDTSGSITCTSWTTQIASGFTCSEVSNVIFTPTTSGVSYSISHGNTTAPADGSGTVSYTIKNGAGTVGILGHVKSVVFDSTFTGQWAGSFSTVIFYKSFISHAGMTTSNNSSQVLEWRGTSSTDCFYAPANNGNSGSPYRLRLAGTGILKLIPGGNGAPTYTEINSGTLDLNGNTFPVIYPIYLNAGTIDLNGGTLVGGIYSGGTAASTINFRNGTIRMDGGSASAWSATNTNLTTTNTETGKIEFTGTGAKYFDGGSISRVYPKISNAGSGEVFILGTSTYENIETTVFPATFKFQFGRTTTFKEFTLSGSPTGKVFLRKNQDTYPVNQQYYFSKTSGTVNASYLDIQFCNASGGATWNAFTSNGNTDSGTNNGWIWLGPTGFFLMF